MFGAPGSGRLKIHQRGVQWKQGVVVYILWCIVLLNNTTPIHCTPLRLHPPMPSIHRHRQEFYDLATYRAVLFQHRNAIPQNFKSWRKQHTALQALLSFHNAPPGVLRHTYIYIYICLYIYIYTYIHLSLSLYIYIYTYTHIHICIHQGVLRPGRRRREAGALMMVRFLDACLCLLLYIWYYCLNYVYNYLLLCIMFIGWRSRRRWRPCRRSRPHNIYIYIYIYI